MVAMEQRLSQILSQRQKQPIAEAGLIVSAVLVPIYRKRGRYYILFTKRTERVREHKGQVSFPGGARHKVDKTLFDTALRESAEEIGLAPTEVKILGELDDMRTETSNYIITPFVALIPYPYQFKVDGWEVEEIIEAPISALLDKDLRPQTRVIDVDGQSVTSYFYHYQGSVIWGATANILHQFLGIFAQAMRG
jgi:8-oxo-dGTP pyrophosphatase MutT (NUDIX family)